jgi:dihydrodipicolinate synthase/N-acetylneuraminate lyase
MASGNGRKPVGWAWDEALCGVVPPLISPLIATGELDTDAGAAKAACAALGIGNGLPAPPLAALGAEGRARVAAIVRRHAAVLAR